MTSNFWRWVLVVVTLIPIYVVFFHSKYSTEAIAVFAVSGIISLVVGLRSIKKHQTVGIVLTIIGALAVALVLVIAHAAFGSPPGRPKGSTAIVKANLANIRAQAQILYDENNPHTYQNVCKDDQVQRMLTSAKEESKSIKCFNDTDSFVAAAAFKKPTTNDTNWCVDSTGAARIITSEQYIFITTTDTLCPQ